MTGSSWNRGNILFSNLCHSVAIQCHQTLEKTSVMCIASPKHVHSRLMSSGQEFVGNGVRNESSREATGSWTVLQRSERNESIERRMPHYTLSHALRNVELDWDEVLDMQTRINDRRKRTPFFECDVIHHEWHSRTGSCSCSCTYYGCRTTSGG